MFCVDIEKAVGSMLHSRSIAVYNGYFFDVDHECEGLLFIALGLPGYR